MATNAKRKNPEQSDPSELEVMRVKIRKLEAIVAKTKTENLNLMSQVEELQKFKNDQVGHQAHENEAVDILFVFMNNNGFKRIAYKILSFLDCDSFVLCRQICRSWKNFIDNEWSMLQLQIFHLKRHPNRIEEWNNSENPYHHLLHEWGFNFGPLIKVMEKTTNKSKLRTFINMCQEFVQKRCLKVEENPLRYMIDHHRHQELELLIDYPMQKNLNKSYYGTTRQNSSSTEIFKYACQYGCKICVKLLLDRSEQMEIDLNLVHKGETDYLDVNYHEHCLHVADSNQGDNHKGYYKKGIIDLLLRSAEEKGIDINVENRHGSTLRDKIIWQYNNWFGDIEDYSEASYKILKIDSSVDLKREGNIEDCWLFKERE